MTELLRPVVTPDEFARLFGGPFTHEAFACGRVNLIGEHTDYNGGFVLPTAIPQATTAVVAPGRGRTVRAWSADIDGGGSPVEYELGREQPGRGWIDYVQGTTVALSRAGFAVQGFDVAFRSFVPVGSGLSSSAALEVSLLRAIRSLFALTLDDVTLAKIGRAAETDFVGAPIGIMDQMSASLASPGEALFIDTRTLETARVPLPPGTELLVINSGVAHSHAGGDYRTRRAECERAAELLGVRELRDLGVADLARVSELPPPLDRRARHVITENQRVLDAVEAMREGRADELGRLFDESHASQRDDYEVSVPEIDLLVALASEEPAVYGARLTGGGFGGSIVALVRDGEAAAVGARIASGYDIRTGRSATVLVPPEAGPRSD
ncbi:MAG TPA: galactokinase [Vicinamibacterales bacterium]